MNTGPPSIKDIKQWYDKGSNVTYILWRCTLGSVPVLPSPSPLFFLFDLFPPDRIFTMRATHLDDLPNVTTTITPMTIELSLFDLLQVFIPPDPVVLEYLLICFSPFDNLPHGKTVWDYCMYSSKFACQPQFTFPMKVGHTNTLENLRRPQRRGWPKPVQYIICYINE